MKYIIVILLIATCVGAGCEKKAEKVRRVLPGQDLKQPAITDRGIEAVKSRMVAAGNIILRYVEKHGVFPEATTSLELRDVLRKDFGSEPDFEQMWISHNGKALLNYNQGLPGKRLEDIPNKDSTWMLKDPIGFPDQGYVIVFCSGKVDAVIERPVGAGALPM